MKLNSNDLKKLCDEAITAAENAGRLISTYTNKSIKVERKSGGSTLASQVVTEVDLKSQDAILEILLPTIEKYDLGLLTEEIADDGSRLEKDYFWCIDPLDGTLPFTQGKPGYSVSIALVAKNGDPVIGVVLDPVKQILYYAIKGQGVFRKNEPWQLASSLCTFSFVPASTLKTHFKQSKIIRRIIRNTSFTKTKAVPIGGAVMNAICVLENLPACYIKFPKQKPGGGSLWDYAATACIAMELGCFVRNIKGEVLNLNNRETTFMNQSGVIYSTDMKHLNTIVKAIHH